jgi:hypothetical protein
MQAKEGRAGHNGSEQQLPLPMQQRLGEGTHQTGSRSRADGLRWGDREGTGSRSGALAGHFSRARWAPSRGRLTAARKSLADVKRTRETRFSVKAARGRENGTHADMERGGRGERLLAYGSQQGAAEAASCSGACSTRNSEAAPQTRSNRYT